jgi:ribosome maturation factor RimP
VPERETIAAAIEPVLTTLGLELFDLQFTGSGRARTLRVIVDRDGGVDLDAITAAAERITPVLDNDDALGRFSLEVSSPGLERPLRRPDHFRGAVGETVSVKVRGDDGEVRRLRGELVATDEQGITVDAGGAGGAEHVDYDEIIQARTVFEWGAAPKPDKRAKREKKNARKKKEVVR